MVHSSMPDGKWTAILAGPGMGRTATTREQVLHLLEDSSAPLILDADAITVLAEQLDAISSAKCPVILTPHPGEFAALFGLKADEVQEDRMGLAGMAAVRLNAIVVLKGAGTLVASPDKRMAVNMTGKSRDGISEVPGMCWQG